jgi:hypothetical protein
MMIMNKPTTERMIRLPRSNSQSPGSLSYAVLIKKICPQRTMGDAFEGRRLRPGSIVPESQLCQFAKNPLILEYAGSDRSGSGHRRSSHIYILWRYQADIREPWRELARTTAEGLEWITVLRPIAIQQLSSRRTQRGGKDPVVEQAGAAISRVLSLLHSEMEILNVDERRCFLGFLYEQVLGVLSRERISE